MPKLLSPIYLDSFRMNGEEKKNETFFLSACFFLYNSTRVVPFGFSPIPRSLHVFFILFLFFFSFLYIVENV